MVDFRDVTDRVGLAARPNTLVTAGFLVVAVISLYVGAGIFVPLVLAVLLAFALAPLVNRLRRLHLPHIVAVLLSVLIAAIVLATIAYVAATQVVKLAADLPSYQATVAAKIKNLQTSFGGANFLDRLGTAVEQLKAQIAPTASPEAARPLPVAIANTPQNPLGMAQSILGSVLGPLATAAIVVVFLIFLLLERADLRDRFLKLVSRGDLRTSTKVMNEAASRVGRYLLVQFGVNLVYGLVFGTGLTLIGVPSGILWGLLATLFRYIPFVGTLVVATIPFTLAFAVDPGWGMLIKSILLLVGLELVTTNVIEPRLYGSSTGLSPLAVLIAAMFWATLWGPIGLILSTPLTVCLVVLGRYVPQLQFLEILLGSEPVLRPEERLYQRLVAGNVEEATELAEEYVGDGGPTAFYEKVALPALRLAEADLSIDAADLVQRRQVVESLEGVLDELADEQQVDEDAADILVIGGKTELDMAAARLVDGMLRDTGYATRLLPPLAIRREALSQLDPGKAETICLVYIGENVRSSARFVARRLRRGHPALRIIVCLLDGQAVVYEDTPASFGAAAVVTTTAELTTAIGPLQRGNAAPAAEPAVSASALAAQNLETIIRTNPDVSQFLKHVAEKMGVAAAIANAVDARHAAVGATESTLAGDSMHGSTALAEHVAAANALVLVPDVSKDEQFSQDAFLLESGVRFYAGVPLTGKDSTPLGVLAIMDESPRELEPAEVEELLGFAASFVARYSIDGSVGVATAPALPVEPGA